MAVHRITVPTRREKTVAVATPIIPQWPTNMAKEDKIALSTLVKRLTTMEIRGRPLARRILPKVVIKIKNGSTTKNRE